MKSITDMSHFFFLQGNSEWCYYEKFSKSSLDDASINFKVLDPTRDEIERCRHLGAMGDTG